MNTKVCYALSGAVPVWLAGLAVWHQSADSSRLDLGEGQLDFYTYEQGMLCTGVARASSPGQILYSGTSRPIFPDST